MILRIIDPEEINMQTLIYANHSDVALPEPFTDEKRNGVFDAGKPFDDVNGNGEWDEDQGRDGLGDSGDVVVYRLRYDCQFMILFSGRSSATQFRSTSMPLPELGPSAPDGPATTDMKNLEFRP